MEVEARMRIAAMKKSSLAGSLERVDGRSYGLCRLSTERF